MIFHATDLQLDLYLDDGLDFEEQRSVEAHVATCADCRQRLELMRPLFQALEALAAPVPEGLAQGVMSHVDDARDASLDVPQRLTWLVFALQGLTSLALLAILIRQFQDWLPPLPEEWFSVVVERADAILGAVGTSIHQALDGVHSVSSAVASSLPERPSLALTSTQMVIVLIAATSLLIVGNSLLLRGDPFDGNNYHQKEV